MKNLPISYKFLGIITVLILLMLFLLGSNYITYQSLTEESALRTLGNSTEQAAAELDTYFSDLSHLSLVPMSQKYDSYDFAHIIEESSSGSKAFNADAVLDDMLQKLLSYKPSLQSIMLAFPDGSVNCVMPNYWHLHSIDIQSQPWFDDMLYSSGKAKFLPAFTFQVLYDGKVQNKTVFPIVRTIRIIPSGQVVGMLMLNTELSYLKELVQRMEMFPDQRTMIVSDAGDVIYDSAQNDPSQVSAENYLSAIQHGNGASIDDLGGERCLRSYSTAKDVGWTVVSVVSADVLHQKMNFIAQRTTIWMVLIIFCAVFVTYFTSKYISKPLRSLTLSMQLVERGQFDVSLTTSRTDEIGILTNAFNHMVSQINQLIQEKYINQLTQKKLEISMLQMQINPHFLYNTLESISMMAEINDDREAADMASSLGRLLRYSLHNKKAIVPLWQEIYYLSQYINLQHRWEHQFMIEEFINPALYTQQIIPLSLQPILENAINHGMESVKKGGMITISSKRQSDFFSILVHDNGSGIPPEKLEQLNDYINEKNENFSGVGLRNVNKRIKLRMGEKYGLIIHSSAGKGTTVGIRLPYGEYVDSPETT